MDVICSERDCGRTAIATKAVSLTEGRDKSKLISIWVCELHRQPEEGASPSRRLVGEASTSSEIAI
jgi:hypothetical protein